MISQKIRTQFLEYFKSKEHTIVPSSPVVPYEDPTLLFVNAGMNQFKDVFLGKSKREYTRASSCQKCIRVGGKHNDLENVGHTTRHITFFEMLGNFSFGDYFKREAIQFGFEMAVNVLNLDFNKIYATVLYNDDEAFELWTKYLPSERIVRMSEKDNFWAMGETGPCGPCSELLYDRGNAFGNARTPSEDIQGERFFEFWNLVFMQYNRTQEGMLEALPKQSVDTGAGLERVALLKMGVRSVFETDILRGIISEIEHLFGKTYDPNNAEKAAPFHVIADHLRCLSFACSDGVQPSNIDRGYVLRKVLRRAVRYARILGIDKPFLGKLLPRLVSSMGSDYPALVSAQDRITDILTTEEENFFKTLQRGGNILNQIIAHSSEKKLISGEDAFKLKDTYGLPLDEILLLAKDAHLSVDIPHFEQLEKEAKERSRMTRKSATQGPINALYSKILDRFGPTHFHGYEELTCEGTILAIIKNDQQVDILNEGEEGTILLDNTVFYAEKGGQVGDSGHICGNEGQFIVSDTKSPISGSIYHFGILQKGNLHVNEKIYASVDHPKRIKIANNHTATHLLHWALEQVLGSHVKQAGSVVDPERLRFDFNHNKALSFEEVVNIENLVNQKIRENASVRNYELTHEEATKRQDIKQFFGDKYGSIVRVVDIGFSKELCGGTHAKATGSIGLFKITKESSIAAGVRRIEAATGFEAESFARQFEKNWYQIADLLNTQETQILDKTKSLLNENNTLLSEIKKLKKEMFAKECQSLFTHILTHQEISYLVFQVPFSSKEVKDISDLLFNKQKSLALFLICHEGAVHVRISKDLVQKGLSSDHWLKEVISKVGGKGGGNADMAQGTLPLEKRDQAFESARLWIQKL